MKLSVLLVNYNVKFFLEQCLCSVLKATTNLEAEILVADNHSSDGSREYFTNKFPSVRFTWLTENLGFAKANNELLKQATGDYVLFLNPDTIVPEDCFEKCIHFFESKSNCGGLGIRMIDGAGQFLKESKRSFPSPATSFYKMSGLAKLFPRSPVFAKYYAGHLHEHETHEIEVLAGAFIMLSQKALTAVTGFDEQFFMYAEDIDLSYRVQLAGFKNYYIANTCCIHFKGESTQKNNPEYVNRFYGAMQLFVKKHYASKKLTLFCMSMAVSMGKLLARIRHMLSLPVLSHANTTLLVVASQAYFNEVIQLIKYAEKPRVISGRIAIDEDDKETSSGKLTNLPTLLDKSQTGELLFCEGDISYSSILQYMQELKGKTSFLLHAENSNSIVGSSSKTQNGISIARPGNAMRITD